MHHIHSVFLLLLRPSRYRCNNKYSSMLANHCVRGRRIGENINAVYYFNNIDLCSNVSNMHACDVVTIEIKLRHRDKQPSATEWICSVWFFWWWFDSRNIRCQCCGWIFFFCWKHDNSADQTTEFREEYSLRLPQ